MFPKGTSDILAFVWSQETWVLFTAQIDIINSDQEFFRFFFEHLNLHC